MESPMDGGETLADHLKMNRWVRGALDETGSVEFYVLVEAG